MQKFNESGMYSVRLFLEGEWRGVVVDDFIPVDRDGQPVSSGQLKEDVLLSYQEYEKNQTRWLDFKILLLTIRKLTIGR